MISEIGHTSRNGQPVNGADRGVRSRGEAEGSAPVVADLCCGMGGLSLAARQLGMRVVVGVDNNFGAIRTFSKNFPEAEAIEKSVRSKAVVARCVQLLNFASEGAAPSIVLSGPPCQGFSAAGSRDPVDRRNQILLAVARAVVALRPHCALVENVSMLLADKHDERLKQFGRTLAKGHYAVTNLLLDAVDFGVAQKRKRAFFLIAREALDEQEILGRLERFKRRELSTKSALGGLPTPPVRPDDYKDDGDYQGVSNHFAMQHSKRVMRKIAALEPGKGPMSYRKLHPLRPSNTLFSGHRAPPAHFKQARSITVREAARLQGFPDTFRVYGSFANQMEQVTNAVPPPLAQAVLRVLAEFVGISLPPHESR